MEYLRLGVFDLNGTIHPGEKGVSAKIRAGFGKLSERNIATTIATGKGLSRAQSLLGQEWSLFVSPNKPVSMENGGRLSSQNGSNLRYYRLERETITSALDVVNTHLAEVSFIAYYPQNPDQNPFLWTPQRSSGIAYMDFRRRHGVPEMVSSQPITELVQIITEDSPCRLIVNFNEPEMAEVFYGASTAVNGNDVNILEQGVNKARGVMDIAEITETPLNEIFVAGNDQNDIPMLLLPVGRRLLVGSAITETIPDIVRLSSPEDLGDYLYDFEACAD